MIFSFGKPTHLQSHNDGWSVCGVQSKHMVEKGTAGVDCLRCRKTNVFKCHAAFEKVKRLQASRDVGFININAACMRGHLNGIKTKIP